MNLYRFRSIKSLLDRKELENQEIYFAPFEQLNDPIEGFKDIFWQGDSIIWKNLLKNYLLCLQVINSLYFVVGKDLKLNENHIQVFMTAEQLPSAEVKTIYEKVCNLFFKNDSVISYIEYLSSRKKGIRRNELFFHISNLHLYALNCMHAIFIEHNLLDKRDNFFSMYENVSIWNLNADFLIDESTVDFESIIEEVCVKQKNIEFHKSVKFLSEDPSLCDFNRIFIRFDFPERYIQQLEKLVHPDWFTACFLSDYNNSSLWGYYGDDHKGVCLKFKASVNLQNQPVLHLTGANGVGKDENKKKRFINGQMECLFYKINYNSKYPEIDFFQFLGRLSGSLQSYWYLDENKNISSCAERMFSDESSWRQEYWQDFYSCTTTKLESWGQEKEYRLIRSGDIINSLNVNRKHKFNFSDLDGIIFGIKTTFENKLKILSIIKEKCIQEKRSDFNFYQAYYSKPTGNIEIIKIELL